MLTKHQCSRSFREFTQHHAFMKPGKGPKFQSGAVPCHAVARAREGVEIAFIARPEILMSSSTLFSQFRISSSRQRSIGSGFKTNKRTCCIPRGNFHHKSNENLCVTPVEPQSPAPDHDFGFAPYVQLSAMSPIFLGSHSSLSYWRVTVASIQGFGRNIQRP